MVETSSAELNAAVEGLNLDLSSLPSRRAIFSFAVPDDMKTYAESVKRTEASTWAARVEMPLRRSLSPQA